MIATTSIHYRRRWFYLLWSLLLLACISALVIWETPRKSGTSKLTLRLQVKDLPRLTVVKVWAGPRGRWPGAAWTGQNAAAQITPADDNVFLDAFPLTVAYRRWGKDTIPRGTSDLVVLRFEAPGQPPRYMPLPLGQDWRTGYLAPGRVMRISMDCGWIGLALDPAGFAGLE